MGQKIFIGSVSLLFLYLIYPLLLPIVMGIIFSVLFFPCLDWMERAKVSRYVGALVLTLSVTLVLILPFSTALFFLVKLGIERLQDWDWNWHWQDGVQRVVHWVMGHFSFQFFDQLPKLMASIQDLMVSIGGKVAESLARLLRQLPGIMVSLLVLIVSFFFFLLDGRNFIALIKRYSFFNSFQTDLMLQALAKLCRAVVLASVVSGLFQGSIEFFICFFWNVPYAAWIGFSVFLASFIPLIGALPITFGVGVQQFLDGRSSLGLALIAIALLTFVADNAIRPLFLRGAVDLHPFLAFVSAFGALQVIGFSGVFIGPILAGLVLLFFEIIGKYKKEKQS